MTQITITNIRRRHCKNCGVPVSNHNKSGICHTCLLIVYHWQGKTDLRNKK